MLPKVKKSIILLIDEAIKQSDFESVDKCRELYKNELIYSCESEKQLISVIQIMGRLSKTNVESFCYMLAKFCNSDNPDSSVYKE